MNNDVLKQALKFLLETAEVMVQFRQSPHQIVQNLEEKFDKSLFRSTQDGYRDGMCGSDERNVKFCSTDFWQ